MKLLVVGCVQTKRSTSAGELLPAADLYCSSLWHKRRRYAEASGGPWLILSALHGLILPDKGIATYDTTIDNVTPLRSPGSHAWHVATAAELQRLVDELHHGDPLVIELHAGAAYAARLREACSLVHSPIYISTPLARLKIGEQAAWYNARHRA